MRKQIKSFTSYNERDRVVEKMTLIENTQEERPYSVKTKSSEYGDSNSNYATKEEAEKRFNMSLKSAQKYESRVEVNNF